MLYLKPELVLAKEHWGDGNEKKNTIKAFSEGWVWAERKWSQISNDIGVGNPIAATKEKGEAFFKDVTQKMGDFMFELAMANTKNLYK